MELTVENKQKPGRWPEESALAMAELAKLFPSLRDAPGTDPWSVEQLIGWLNTDAPKTGSRSAGMFLLGVWDPIANWWFHGLKRSHAGRFDFFRAIGAWDEKHMQAFQEWLANPFWP
jgi:hypothetical protein